MTMSDELEKWHEPTFYDANRILVHIVFSSSGAGKGSEIPWPITRVPGHFKDKICIIVDTYHTLGTFNRSPIVFLASLLEAS